MSCDDKKLCVHQHEGENWNDLTVDAYCWHSLFNIYNYLAQVGGTCD